MGGALNRPTISVQIALPSGAGGTWMTLNDSSLGKLNTATVGDGPNNVASWTDVTQYVYSVTTKRGRTRQLESFSAGTCTIVLDNSDRRFDPTNTSSPYVLAGSSQIKPMLGVRVIANWNGIDYPMFRGYADSWDIQFSDPDEGTATLTATDGFKVLSRFNPAALAVGVGAGEDTGARITRILDWAGWPTADRAVETGLLTCLATTLGSDALTLSKLTADTEMGDFFIDGSGRATFFNRSHRYANPSSSTPAFIFGDAATGELNYESVVVLYDDDLVKNYVGVSNVGGTESVVQDLTSQGAYLVRTYRRDDLVHSDSTYSLTDAQLIVYRFKDADLRFDSVMFLPDVDTSFWPACLGLEIGTKVTVNKTPPDYTNAGVARISRSCFIEGITHTIPKLPGPWTTTFQLSDASKFFGMILNDTVYGALNAAVAVCA